LKSAILLLAHGTPDSATSVPEFLRYVTNGRELPAAVVKEVQERYRRIGHSPLTEITHRQAQRLARRLDLPVYVGMRNWHPFIADAVRQIRHDAIGRVAAICLAPQNSRTSTGLYRQALAAAGVDFALEFVSAWHDHPLLVRAFAARLEPAWNAASQAAGQPAPLVFTAHSVPSRTITEGDPYEAQARETAQAVAAEIGQLPEGGWRLAFQSQGKSGGEWLGPTVETTLEELATAGHKHVVVQPIGFLADHVEVLYDIDVVFRDFAAARGVALVRPESLNDSPLLTMALADIARAALGRVAAGAMPLDAEVSP
jgi:ferrochelatase